MGKISRLISTLKGVLVGVMILIKSMKYLLTKSPDPTSAFNDGSRSGFQGFISGL